MILRFFPRLLVPPHRGDDDKHWRGGLLTLMAFYLLRRVLRKFESVGETGGHKPTAG